MPVPEPMPGGVECLYSSFKKIIDAFPESYIGQNGAKTMVLALLGQIEECKEMAGAK